MTSGLQTAERIEPKSGTSAQQLVIILHGYGANGADLIDLGQAWSGVLPNAAFVAPDAPDPLPFEAFGGRQWFALADRDIREYRIGVSAATPVLQTFIDNELDRYGVAPERLVLIGFSQGAMMALSAGLSRSVPPAGILAYSGVFAGPETTMALAPPAILLVHGADDDVVSPDYLEAARAGLETLGASVNSHLLTDLGHGIDERGMVLGGRFLAELFPQAPMPLS